MAQKRQFNEGKRHFKKNKKQKTTSAVADGSNEEVLLADIKSLLISKRDGSEETGESEKTLPDTFTELDVTISELSSTGDGLANVNGHIYVVPFSSPGDVVTIKVIKHFESQSYSLADFVKVVTAGPHRTETPKCRYFSKCAGCQFQYLPYQYQLDHKRRIVEKAFANFSKLPASSVPTVGETIGSPLQYGYRTKLTPHFDGPPGGRRDRRNGEAVSWPEVPPIGFMLKGTRKTLDIEECPIGTEAVQLGMKRERARVNEEINKYQRGATLLLRETTQRVKKGDSTSDKDSKLDKDVVVEDRGEVLHHKSCITDAKAVSTEYIDDFRLDNPAGAFFQNNNSILPVITQYIRDNILGPAQSTTDSTTTKPQIKNMIDAYCGSGFFTINLSGMFKQSIGIDISAQSVEFATKNAELNNLPSDSTKFIAGDASNLFASVSNDKFPPAETAVVIDPSRKGCDQNFIRQLIDYGPERLCYVSCNVHTQARDIGWLVGGLPAEDGDEKKAREGMYEIESVRGFDFFPQTGHVEGVAILQKKKTGSREAA